MTTPKSVQLRGIPPALWERVAKAAYKDRRAINQWVMMAIEEKLERSKDGK